MRQFTRIMRVSTRGQGLHTITREVAAWVEEQRVATGLLTVFLQHTSASLTIQENADPDVIRDVNEFFLRLVRENEPWYRHTTEGPDDMPAHIRSVLTQTSLSIPVMGGHLMLGAWQGIYLFEHRTRRHQRSLVLHLLGESNTANE
jgi:secondary thiamine-phosphate synthase enzyme